MRSHLEQALQAGRRWAEEKADALDEMPAASWPAEWVPSPGWKLRLEGGALSDAEVDELLVVAHREAASRWREIFEDRFGLEDERGRAEEPQPPEKILTPR